ncbi:hypothetical protein BU17DRAFT_91632 [Hysterangium stoloniferum]|nr:hypothetical protein BU17DRAFT_91632 [Hysterangium stoloniferum]
MLRSLRPLTRLTGRASGHPFRTQFGVNSAGRARGVSSSTHGHSTQSDKPWIIGSALVFGPALIYLLGPGQSPNVVTGHGDPHKDPHPSGHGSAPAPDMQKGNPPVDHESEEKAGEASAANEDSQGGIPENEPKAVPDVPAAKPEDGNSPDVTVEDKTPDKGSGNSKAPSNQQKDADSEGKEPSEGEVKDSPK